MNIKEEIKSINWKDYTTISKNSLEIPELLMALFLTDKVKVQKAIDRLWESLCHQHSFITSPALPSYKFLRYALLNLENEIKVDILDIFLGFTRCLKKSHFESLGRDPFWWELSLQKLINEDKKIFESFVLNENEDISCFSTLILNALDNNETDISFELNWDDFPPPNPR